MYCTYLEKQSVSKCVLPFHCLKNFWNSKLEIIFSFVRSEILETKYSFISIFGNKELLSLLFFGLSLFQILRYFFKKLPKLIYSRNQISISSMAKQSFEKYLGSWNWTYELVENVTVRPWDTRPQDARTLQVHVFELGPKKFELNEFM